MKLYNPFRVWFQTFTPRDLLEKSLEEAQFDLIEQTQLAEHANAMVTMLEERVRKLQLQLQPELYECHVTVASKNAVAAEAIAQSLGWKTSQIARDPLLGDDTFFYLTCHGVDQSVVMAKCGLVANELNASGIKVLRQKIERIVYDTKTRGVK